MGKTLKYLYSFDQKILAPLRSAVVRRGHLSNSFKMINERGVWEFGFVARQAAFTAYKFSFILENASVKSALNCPEQEKKHFFYFVGPT
jgi:hypothetical protein